MFNNVKLGTKITAGFSVLILISLILGGLAVVKMKDVVAKSRILGDEYAPEAKLASDLERRVNLTRYAILGYALTHDRKYLEEGQTGVIQVKDAVVEAEKLAGSAANLTQLNGSLDNIKKAMNDYERLIGETEKTVATLGKLSTDMNNVAKIYMENSSDYLKAMNKSMLNVIADEDSTFQIRANHLKMILLINDINNLGNAARIGNLDARANRNMQIMADGIKTIFPEIEKIVQELASITLNLANQKQIKDILAQSQAYKTSMENYLRAFDELDKLIANLGMTGTYALEMAGNLMKNAVDGTNDIADQAADSLSAASKTVMYGLVAALVAGILMAVFITRTIIVPIRKVIDGLNEASEQVSSAAGEVSSASQSLAEGASQQAASVEETSSSLEEMSSMTKQNASNAGQADSLMKQANHVVSKANTSMSQLTTSMQEISRASKETSKIIKTIDEIAFQTNLLALNAAVEAARAGEAGAGFAVVADEVRNLAVRAADAAKNTAALIEGTVKKVLDGTELVKTTNDAFKEVSGSAAKVGELLGEIAAASNEQAQGIEQVNIAVTEMDKVTQQNAATAEESASASEELNAQAEVLKSFVIDLAPMVGGAGSSQGHSSYSPNRNILQNPKIPVASIQKKIMPALSLSPKGEVHPEQLIPINDDELGKF